MDNVDLLLALMSLSYITAAVLSASLALSGRKFRGAGLWISAQGLNAVAAVLDLTPGFLPAWVSAVVANGAYIAACVLFFHAIWIFRFPSRFPRWFYLWILLELFSFAVVLPAPYLTQTVVFAFWLAVGALANGGLLLWKTPREYRLPFGVTASWFLAVGGACVVRVVVLAPLALQNEAFNPASINVLYMAGNILVTTFSLFGYFSLSYIRTHQVLEDFDNVAGVTNLTTFPSPSAEVLVPVSVLVPPEGPHDERIRHFRLSVREWDVARMVIDGLQSKEISDRLFISPGTVKNHLQNIFRKTACSNRAELVRTLLIGKKPVA